MNANRYPAPELADLPVDIRAKVLEVQGDREMIVTTTSAANQCLYCVVAHGAKSNRMASFSNMQPNPEFYLMGRVAKVKEAK